MAAYDLKVNRSPLISVDMDAGARNLAKFSQLIEQSANNKKVNELREDELASLDANRDRVNTNNENITKLNFDKFDFDKGADARALEAQKRLQLALRTGVSDVRGSLADQFQFNDQTIQDVENSELFKNLVSKQGFDRQKFWGDSLSKFKSDIAKHTSPEVYESQLRDKFAGTGASQEQIDLAVKNEMDLRYKTLPENMLPSVLSSAYGGSSSKTSGTKAPIAADVGFQQEENELIKDFKSTYEVESGDGKSIFNPLSWFDAGDQDLTDQNIDKYISTMKGLGFNAAQSLGAIKPMLDGDTIDVPFEKFMTADPEGDSEASQALRKVMSAAQSAKDLHEGTAQTTSAVRGQPDIANMLSKFNRNSSTREQRVELLMGMLPQLKQEIAEGKVDPETANEFIQDVVEQGTDVVEEQPAPEQPVEQEKTDKPKTPIDVLKAELEAKKAAKEGLNMRDPNFYSLNREISSLNTKIRESESDKKSSKKLTVEELNKELTTAKNQLRSLSSSGRSSIFGSSGEQAVKDKITRLDALLEEAKSKNK